MGFPDSTELQPTSITVHGSVYDLKLLHVQKFVRTDDNFVHRTKASIHRSGRLISSDL